MKIDDRRVNGQIIVDASDVVNGFTIAMTANDTMWVSDATGRSVLDPSVVVSQLNSILDAHIMVIRFTIIIANRPVYKVITLPNYTIDEGITIDISPFVSGKELKIDLANGPTLCCRDYEHLRRTKHEKHILNGLG